MNGSYGVNSVALNSEIAEEGKIRATWDGFIDNITRLGSRITILKKVDVGHRSKKLVKEMNEKRAELLVLKKKLKEIGMPNIKEFNAELLEYEAKAYEADAAASRITSAWCKRMADKKSKDITDDDIKCYCDAIERYNEHLDILIKELNGLCNLAKVFNDLKAQHRDKLVKTENGFEIKEGKNWTLDDIMKESYTDFIDEITDEEYSEAMEAILKLNKEESEEKSMNMYEEFLASLEQVEKDATSALESAGTDADEVLGTEEEAPAEVETEAEVEAEGEETVEDAAGAEDVAEEEATEEQATEANTEANNANVSSVRKELEAGLKLAKGMIASKNYTGALDKLNDLKKNLNAAKKGDEDSQWIETIGTQVSNLLVRVTTALKATEGVEEAEAEVPAEETAAEAVEEEAEEETAAADVVEEAPATEDVETEVEDKAEFETPGIEEIDVPDENVLTAGNESLLLLDCLYATSSAAEFKDFLSENKVELELYGLVDTDAIARESWADVESDESEVATEARNIVRLNREAQISRETARIAIGLAKQANDTLYKYYHKYSGLKREFRDKIYAKYGQRAQALARRSLMNSRSKAAMMNSKTGSSIVNKIDSRIKQLDASGRNKEAIQK